MSDSLTSHQFSLNAQQKQQLQSAKQRLNLSAPYYGEIEIAPTMATDTKQVQSVRQYLVTLGIPARHIKILKTLSEADKPRLTRVHLIQYQAMAPNCPGWTEAMTSDVLRYNVGPEGETHFNCTTQANLAKMVSNPKDLVEPANLGHGDGDYLSKTVADLSKGKIGQGDKSNGDAASLFGAASALAAPSPITK